jgi:integrase
MKIHLTPRLVDTLQALDRSVRTLYFDTHPKAPKGFCLRVSSSGARAFYLIRRVRALGSRPWVYLGEAQGAGLDAAREAAWARAGEIALGRDPNVEARRARAAAQEERLQAAVRASEWTVVGMLEAYLRAKQESLSVVTYRNYERTVRAEIGESALATMSARDVVRDDVRLLVSRVAKRAPHVAVHVLALLRAAFRWAMDEEVVVRGGDGGRVRVSRVDRDPTRRLEGDLPAVRAAARRRRTRHLDDEEIVTFWRGTATMRPLWAAFARLILLNGTRRGETHMARRSDLELDGDAPFWRIPAANRKGRAEGSRGARRALVIPLAPLAVRLLRGVLAMERDRVVAADGFSVARVSAAKRDRLFLGFSLGAIGAEIKLATELDVSIHDLRRTTASGLQRLGAPPHVISIVLGHSREEGATQTDGAYAHDPRTAEHRAWLERWAAHVEVLVGAGVDDATPDAPLRYSRAQWQRQKARGKE